MIGTRFVSLDAPTRDLNSPPITINKTHNYDLPFVIIISPRCQRDAFIHSARLKSFCLIRLIGNNSVKLNMNYSKVNYCKLVSGYFHSDDFSHIVKLGVCFFSVRWSVVKRKVISDKETEIRVFGRPGAKFHTSLNRYVRVRYYLSKWEWWQSKKWKIFQFHIHAMLIRTDEQLI